MSVNLNIYLLHYLFEDLVIDVWEVPVELYKAYVVVILLEEPNDIGLCSPLNEVLVLP